MCPACASGVLVTRLPHMSDVRKSNTRGNALLIKISSGGFGKSVFNSSTVSATENKRLILVWHEFDAAQLIAQWLEREFTNQKVRGSKPTSASRLLLSRLEQRGCISTLVHPPGGMAARIRRGVAAEQLSSPERVFLNWIFIDSTHSLLKSKLMLRGDSTNSATDLPFQETQSEFTRTKRTSMPSHQQCHRYTSSNHWHMAAVKQLVKTMLTKSKKKRE
ncbi:hypothetical protein T265_00807 [Opisthorchis viverrini]|uniref:Uncharacterized protein n=1 Tax=Opisthorchis viverrini TaxID=6198 RepID=A0A075A0S3_OPIVI|nr:hypothetical protein T265_00807 [Opisthorchis viverrini]KER33308.1 hypothetical protein T265_00807 [Opisthorchis viverrini]